MNDSRSFHNSPFPSYLRRGIPEESFVASLLSRRCWDRSQDGGTKHPSVEFEEAYALQECH
jgi:hypothetical protein